MVRDWPQKPGGELCMAKKVLAFLQEKNRSFYRSWDLLPTGTATKVMAGVASRHHKNHRSDHSPGHIRLLSCLFWGFLKKCILQKSTVPSFQNPSKLYQSLQLFCLGGLTPFPSFSMVLPRFFQWFSHFPMVLPRFFHVFTKVFPFSHGFPIIFPWFSHVFPCFSHVFPGFLPPSSKFGPVQRRSGWSHPTSRCNLRAKLSKGAPPVNCS